MPLPPSAPCGMVKFSTAAVLVPLFVTAACVPAAPVVTVPMVIDAADPAGPVAPAGPTLPACASKVHTCGNRSGRELELAASARYVEPPIVTASLAA